MTKTAPVSSPWPAFLVGCHRSGTTLLRYILDSHPRICCPPESKFVGGLAAFVDYPQAMSGLASLGVDRERLFRLLRGFIDTVMSTHTRRQGKARWIDKTPNYFRILDFIDTVFDQQALYVFLVRHPCDTICSLLEAPHFKPPVADPDVGAYVGAHGHTDEAFARYWVDVQAQIEAFASAHRDRTFFAAYESLVLAPEPTTTELLRFLGEGYVDGLVTTAFSQRHATGFQDWKIRGTSHVHTESIGRSREWDVSRAERVWGIVGETAAGLGYGSIGGAPTRAHLRWSPPSQPYGLIGD